MTEVKSTFDTGADGWTIEGDVAQFDWEPSGGNPGGHLYWVDAATGAVAYYVAPSAFVGDKSGFYDGTLSYDIEDTGSDLTGYPDVQLTGGGLTLDYSAGQAGTAWTHYTVPLTESGWTVDGSGAAATALQMQDVLGSLTGLLIRAEYVNGAEDGGLDNVDMVACYCAETMILTDRGEVPAGQLNPGDRVVTARGDVVAIQWIGRRTYAGRIVRGRRHLMPVRFRAGSLAGFLGTGLPRRDLRVSPTHAMFLDGALVPASCLTNGDTIVQDHGSEDVEYVHIELARHDVLLAEGAPAESYVEDGNRAVFQNAHEWAGMHPGTHPGTGRTSVRYCAPRIESGPELDQIRRRLAMRVRPPARAA